MQQELRQNIEKETLIYFHLYNAIQKYIVQLTKNIQSISTFQLHTDMQSKQFSNTLLFIMLLNIL